MNATVKNTMKKVMTMAWQFVKKNGMSMSEALKTAWCNIKLHAKMQQGIVKFYFQKIDGTIREAYGTLAVKLIPSAESSSNRKPNPTVQTYYDCEKESWRCFKIANLIRIA